MSKSVFRSYSFLPLFFCDSHSFCMFSSSFFSTAGQNHVDCRFVPSLFEYPSTTRVFFDRFERTMLFKKAVVILLGLATFTEGLSIREEARILRRQNRSGGNSGGFGNKNAAKASISATNNGGNNNAAKASTTAANDGGRNNAAATATCLNSNAVQTGSKSDGQNPPVDGQAASAT